MLLNKKSADVAPRRFTKQKKYCDRTDLNQVTHCHLRVMAHQAQHVSYKSRQISNFSFN